MKLKKTVVVMGILGYSPFAGVAWQGLHYLEGLKRLGYDAYYVEDTGAWPFDMEHNSVTADPSYTVRYLRSIMSWCGMEDRWAYKCAADGQTYGMSAENVQGLFQRADVLINLTGATVLGEEHLRVPVRIYLETDPVLTQIQIAQGNEVTLRAFNTHTHIFTFGENLGATDCGVPVSRFQYFPTRQPVVLDWWKLATSPGPHFTTVSSWQQTGKDIEWNGQVYLWSKHVQWRRFIDLPCRSTALFEVALASNDESVINWFRDYRWSVRDAVALSESISPYRQYIVSSRGELTIAKDQYVYPTSGWFSDRSASYLAAGRPVITQETGFSKFLPTGKGLFAFSTMDEILAAIEEIEADYQGNCRAAEEIAGEYFAAEKVIGSLMERAGL